jgi:integrase/recombinase XerD
MDRHLSLFEDYLTTVRKLSANSVSAYMRDIPDFMSFLAEKGVHDLNSASKADVAAYLLKLKQAGKSASTVNRKLASIRAYYQCVTDKGQLNENPSVSIRSPRIQRKEIEYLTIEEVNRLLTVPDDNNIGCRDLAILEMLYATGLRATELICVNIEDVNLRIGFVSCDGSHGKARIIPLGRPARAALENYIYEIRPCFFHNARARNNNDEKALFLNYYGVRITRQSLWKLLKSYAKKAGLEKKIAPQILRNSFAVHMIQNGADLKSVQELLGHEDPVATQAYLAVSKNRIKDVYDNAHPRAL